MNNLPVVRSPWRIVILLLGFTFLYAPMLMLVIYSFNSSKLVTVWAGWSTRWYGELLRDDAMMSAVGLSLTIAACAATAAAILGTIAAVVLVRFGRFRGSNGFAFMITAPLVMPDVITGLSLLLLFVASAGTGSLDRRSSDGSRCDAAESVFRHYATDDHARDHFWLVTGFYFVA